MRETRSEELIQKPALLLVEDAPDILDVLREALQSEDYDVLEAVNGEEALAHAAHPALFLVILDLTFPDMDGFELASQLRSKSGTDAPLIFLTDLERREALTIQGYEAGAADFIYKPAQPQVIASKARIFFDLYEKETKILKQMDELKDATRKFKEELRERRRMESAVQESEVRYRSLLELSPVSIVVQV